MLGLSIVVEPEGGVEHRTASSISSSGISALTLISLVVTASKLMPRSASVSNIVADSAGLERMPTPTMLTLATASSVSMPVKPIVSRCFSITAAACASDARGTVKVRSLTGWPAVAAWTIMST